jgi:hypothetical protein
MASETTAPERSSIADEHRERPLRENGTRERAIDPERTSEETIVEERPTLSVVVPTLDEEGGIGECIERIENALYEMGVDGEIIVSDSSTDRTPEIAREMDARVVVPDEPGYGYAYRYAFAHARGKYIAIGDADTTYDFEELPKLFELVADGEADMAMGSRLAGEIRPGAMPALHQHVGNPLLTKFLNVFYGAGVSDAHSGFRVIEREALDSLDLSSDGMEFASEMIMAAGAAGLEIGEVPITYHEREGEATLDSFQDGWRHVRFMLLNAPGYLFSLPGIALGTLGAIVMGAAFFGIEVGGFVPGIHSMIAGGLLTIVGYQVAGLGLFAGIAGNPISAPSDPLTEWVLERATLERGATLGVSMFALGGIYGAYLLTEWIASGSLPLLTGDVLAVTAIVLGLQTIFFSFFMSAIADR